MDLQVRQIDRYLLYPPIAHGGMATIHLGRQLGAAGTGRIVAIKRLQPVYANDADFVKMFLDEARITSGIDHLNVIKMLDVISAEGELMLVMELVRGDALSRLFKEATARNAVVPLPILSAVMVGALEGLHAAHEAVDAMGRSLQIVHRDVSPHNILVGTDGVPRIADFGIAKALNRSYVTRSGEIKGKLAYMAPEQIRNQDVDRRADVYAAAVVLWEGLTGERLFEGQEATVLYAALEGQSRPPSSVRPDLSPEIDALVLRGLARDPAERFQTALEMAQAIEVALPPARPRAVGEWVAELAQGALKKQAAQIQDIASGQKPSSEDVETKPEQAEPTATAPGTASDLERQVTNARRVVFGATALAGVVLAVSAAIVWRAPRPQDAPVAGASLSEASATASHGADLEVLPIAGRTSATVTVTAQVAATTSASAAPSSGAVRATPSVRPPPTATPKPTDAVPYPYEF